jgi:AraC-like DNA-binding protein
MTEALVKTITQFRLEDWNQIRVEFDWIYEGQPPPEYLETTVQIPGQSVYLIRKGTLLVRTEKGSVSAGPGQWIIPRQGNRLQRYSVDAEILSVHCQMHWPDGQPLFDWDVAARLEASSVPQLETYSKRLLRHVARHFPSAGHELRLSPISVSDYFLLKRHFSAWMHVFVDILIAQGFMPTRLGSIDPRLLDMVQALDRLPPGAPFRELDFAKRINLSVSQLDRLFVRQFGATPRQYLEKRKLEQAMAQVRNATSIKEVAFALGFSSLQHFSGWFKRKTGLSPSQFQVQNRSAKQSEKIN